MGCNLSSASRVSGNPIYRRPPGFEAVVEPISQAPPLVSVDPAFEEAFNEIVGNVQYIRCPGGMIPCVCLSKQAIPVALSNLCLEDQDPTSISLPIASISMPGKGKIICFSHIQLLAPICFNSDGTSSFIMNAFHWLNPGLTKPILFLGLNEKYQNDAITSLKEQCIQYRIGKIDANPEGYQLVIIGSDINLHDETRLKRLQKYVENGGSLAVFAIPSPDEDFCASSPVNVLLHKYGMAYTYCKLNYGTSRINVDLLLSYDTCRASHFLPYVEAYKELISNGELPRTSEAALDDLVTVLRYHIIVCDHREMDILLSMMDASWKFLNETNYNENGKICSKVQHCIVVILMSCLFLKLPANSFTKQIEADHFPGVCNSEIIPDYHLKIVMHSDTWISTGLWLPAGQIGTIKCKNPPKGLRVQIGSHTDQLLLKQGPWKRWPLLTTSFPVNDGETEVGNSFGGIVYLFMSEEEDMAEVDSKVFNIDDVVSVDTFDTIDFNEPEIVQMSFHNFTKHPRAFAGKPDVYEKSKVFDSPWSELHTKSCILTIPSTDLAKIPDIDQLSSFLDHIILMISRFMSFPLVRPFRIVFDLQKDEDEITIQYPIVLLIDDLPSILFDNRHPSVGFFNFVASICMTSIREDYLDEQTARSIGALVASLVFRELFPGFDPFNLDGLELSPIFQELWLIHTQISSTIIPNLLAKSQQRDAMIFESDEDRWIGFVKDLCYGAKYNLAPLLGKARLIPLNLETILSELPSPPIAGFDSS